MNRERFYIPVKILPFFPLCRISKWPQLDNSAVRSGVPEVTASDLLSETQNVVRECRGRRMLDAVYHLYGVRE